MNPVLIIVTGREQSAGEVRDLKWVRFGGANWSRGTR